MEVWQFVVVGVASTVIAAMVMLSKRQQAEE